VSERIKEFVKGSKHVKAEDELFRLLLISGLWYVVLDLKNNAVVLWHDILVNKTDVVAKWSLRWVGREPTKEYYTKLASFLKRNKLNETIVLDNT